MRDAPINRIHILDKIYRPINAEKQKAAFELSADATTGETIHIICEIKDNGKLLLLPQAPADPCRIFG